MPRQKGSKNAVRTKKAKIDYAAIIAEKTAAKEQIETERLQPKKRPLKNLRKLKQNLY